MNEIIDPHKPDFEKSLEHMGEQLSKLRTGRASASLVEGIMVESYGVKAPLKQLAGINAPDPRTIVIQPWDKNIAVEIEKAIKISDIGLSPVSEGGIIRLNIPSLTEERRKEIVSLLHHRLEDGRIAVRNLRDDIRKKVFAMEEESEITEDDKYRALEDLDKLAEGYTRQIKEMGDAKEKEIMTL